MHEKVIHPFFFYTKTITWGAYLDMLEFYIVLRLEELQPFIIFQQDGAPPHWSNTVQTFLMKHFMADGFGRGGLHGPDTMPLNFFLWGGVCKGLCLQNICG